MSFKHNYKNWPKKWANWPKIEKKF